MHLKTLISKHTDEHFHGRVLAYFDPQLLRTTKHHSVYANRLKFIDYFKYITEELNELQREKFTNIELLVELLNPVYSRIKRSEQNHESFCQNLLEIIQCCMATNHLPDFRKTSEEKILAFWAAAYGNIFVNDDSSKEYSKLITILHIQIKKGFLMNDTLGELKNIKSERSSDENPFCCISWNYLHVLCDSRYLPVKLEDCKTLYNETCHGLANEFIFVPHLWSFIKDALDKESKHHSPYHDSLKNLDKLLMETPVFSDFKPENHHSHRWVF